MSLAYADQPVFLVPYDAGWPALFERERPEIEAAVGPWLDGGVHHVGSTSVPGLAAKPTVDVMAGVRDLEEARAAIEPLAAIGYVHAPYRPHLHWFCKPSPAVRTFHLVLVEPAHAEWGARLRFRDRLRADPGLAAEYAELKRGLAERHRGDRQAYTDAKADFVRRVLAS